MDRKHYGAKNWSHVTGTNLDVCLFCFCIPHWSYSMSFCGCNKVWFLNSYSRNPNPFTAPSIDHQILQLIKCTIMQVWVSLQMFLLLVTVLHRSDTYQKKRVPCLRKTLLDTQKVQSLLFSCDWQINHNLDQYAAVKSNHSPQIQTLKSQTIEGGEASVPVWIKVLFTTSTKHKTPQKFDMRNSEWESVLCFP